MVSSLAMGSWKHKEKSGRQDLENRGILIICPEYAGKRRSINMSTFWILLERWNYL